MCTIKSERVESGEATEETYRKRYNVLKNRAHVKIDTNGKSDTVEWLRREGKGKELLMEENCKDVDVVGIRRIAVGKTTAVKEIRNDEAIKSLFPDGVLYVELGKDATK